MKGRAGPQVLGLEDFKDDAFNIRALVPPCYPTEHDRGYLSSVSETDPIPVPLRYMNSPFFRGDFIPHQKKEPLGRQKIRTLNLKSGRILQPPNNQKVL